MRAPERRLHLALLCAEWCGVCRSWRPEFEHWARQAGLSVRWIDVEDEDALLQESRLDIENFPTLLIANEEGRVHFLGPIAPHTEALQRLLLAARQAPLQSEVKVLSETFLRRLTET